MFVLINGQIHNKYLIQSIDKEGLSIFYKMSNGVIIEEKFENEASMLEKYNSFISS